MKREVVRERRGKKSVGGKEGRRERKLYILIHVYILSVLKKDIYFL